WRGPRSRPELSAAAILPRQRHRLREAGMHIGLIGGIGPAATEYYYRGLIERYARSGITLDLTIVHADVQEMARNLASGAAQVQAEIFARLIRRLAAAGAEIA